MLLHRVYVGASSCYGSDYISYKSPFGCYTPNNYDGVEHNDVYDEILQWDYEGRPTWYRRTYFNSNDGSCQGQDQIEGASDEGSFGVCSTSGGDDYIVSVEDTLTW